MLDLPVRRLPNLTGYGTALILDDADVDDAGGGDGQDGGPVDGPRVNLDGIDPDDPVVFPLFSMI
jgi:hypothetical protein